MPRRHALLKRYVPPAGRASEQKIKTFHTKELFKGASTLFEDISVAILKSVQRETGLMAIKTAKGLNALRDTITSADRVKHNITHGSLLQEAIDDGDALETLNKMTGQNLSLANAKTIKEYIDRYDQASPLENHVKHMKILMNEAGVGRLENGRLVRNNIAARFKETTGKDFNSLMPEKVTNQILDLRFKADAQNMLADGVASGSITYRQGLVEAAKALGKGTEAYEKTKLQMYNGLYARLAKNRGQKDTSEEEALARLRQTDFNISQVGKRFRKSKDPRMQKLFNEQLVTDSIAKTEENLLRNTDPSISTAEIVDTTMRSLEAAGVPSTLRSSIRTALRSRQREVLKPGFEMYAESVKPKIDIKGLREDPFKEERHYQEYYKFYSVFNGHSEAFRGVDQQQKAVFIAKSRDALTNYLKQKLGMKINAQDAILTPDLLNMVQERYGASDEVLILLGMHEAGMLDASSSPAIQELKERIDQYYIKHFRPGQNPETAEAKEMGWWEWAWSKL